jgi:glycosyltransferase involved in cell wall biosynthesis
VNNSPLVSVVIPTYNRGYILREAIESALNQGSAHTEVMVVDDGSTDDTASVAAEYTERVEYLYQENQGPGAARSLGVRSTRSDYVAFLDSDDVWLPGKVETELELFERFPAAGAIASDADSWLEGSLVEPSWLRSKQGPMGSSDPYLFPLDPPLWLQGSLFATSNLTIRRRCLEKVGDPVFDASLRFFEDWDLEIRLLRFCRILIVPKVLARIRRFLDGTRKNRAMPGSDLTLQQARESLQMQLRVLENAIALEGWPGKVDSKLKEARERVLAKLA